MFSIVNYTMWHPLPRALLESLCFLLLPYLLGFIVKSHAVLIHFVHFTKPRKVEDDTVSHTIKDEPPAIPENPKVEDDTVNHAIKDEPQPIPKRHLILGSTLFILIAVLQQDLYRRGPPTNLPQIAWNVAEVSLYAFLITVVFRAASQIGCYCFVYFSKSTIPLKYMATIGKTSKTHQSRPSRLFAFYAICGIYFTFWIVLGLSGSNNSLSVWLVTLALVHYASDGRQFSRTKQLRGMFNLWVFFSPSYFIYVYIFLAICRENLSQDEENIWPVITVQSIYVSFIPAAMASYFSGAVISRMLRFDYKTYAKKESERRSDALEEGEAGRKLTMEEGALARFPKPYFIAAITAWSIIRVATIVLCLTTGFPAKSPYDACFYAVLVEFPFMVAAVLFFGIWRGEAKVVWNDEELWTTGNARAPKRSYIVRKERTESRRDDVDKMDISNA